MRFYLAHLSVIADNMLHSRRCMDLSRLDIVALHYTHSTRTILGIWARL